MDGRSVSFFARSESFIREKQPPVIPALVIEVQTKGKGQDREKKDRFEVNVLEFDKGPVSANSYTEKDTRK